MRRLGRLIDNAVYWLFCILVTVLIDLGDDD